MSDNNTQVTTLYLRTGGEYQAMDGGLDFGTVEGNFKITPPIIMGEDQIKGLCVNATFNENYKFVITIHCLEQIIRSMSIDGVSPFESVWITLKGPKFKGEEIKIR